MTAVEDAHHAGCAPDHLPIAKLEAEGLERGLEPRQVASVEVSCGD
jgi:hypothetical protein